MAAQSTDEALKLITGESANPEFIIADFRLPGGSDGGDAITKIQLLLGEAIPSLVITGDIELGRKNVISELGYRVLKKPVRPAKLRRLMTHLLNQHRRDSITYEIATRDKLANG
jgi:CheY-like chemotaxis protein